MKTLIAILLLTASTVIAGDQYMGAGKTEAEAVADAYRNMPAKEHMTTIVDRRIVQVSTNGGYISIIKTQ